ncbi:MAG: PEP-CTERM sorting domain-containing protein [Thermoguttaceae bacterium]
MTNPAALPEGMSLTVGAGGTFIFDPSVAGEPVAVSSGAAVAAVPEPGTLMLAAAGALVAFAAWRRARN